ncbi:unnamed protein product [Caenorhabditis bovis]|uniref:Uncharacterized protein n=1 Tax=Caenorhabditis bovis TaxID=2654633 RepID=A0A8S1F6G3_9PELO|nr:unnamed protein product [Caenorhabditis bovis]
MATKQSEHNFKQLEANMERILAQRAICYNCGHLLAFAHIFSGISLLMIDVASNYLSRNAVIISFAFIFIICAILSFITARRLDRLALKILLVYSLISLTAAVYLFVKNGLFLNEICMKRDECTKAQQWVHSNIVIISLIEVAASIISIIFCGRSLKHAAASQSLHHYDHLHEVEEAIEKTPEAVDEVANE